MPHLPYNYIDSRINYPWLPIAGRACFSYTSLFINFNVHYYFMCLILMDSAHLETIENLFAILWFLNVL